MMSSVIKTQWHRKMCWKVSVNIFFSAFKLIKIENGRKITEKYHLEEFFSNFSALVYLISGQLLIFDLKKLAKVLWFPNLMKILAKNLEKNHFKFT